MVLSHPDLAELVRRYTQPLLLIALPLPLDLAAVCEVEHAQSFPHALLPLSRVPVPQQLVLAPLLKPDVLPGPVLLVVGPMAYVLLLRVQPHHHPKPFFLVVYPTALVVIATRVRNLSLTVFAPLLKLAHVLRPVRKVDLTLALPKSVFPLAHVLGLL